MALAWFALNVSATQNQKPMLYQGVSLQEFFSPSKKSRGVSLQEFPRNLQKMKGVSFPESGVNLRRNWGSAWAGIFTSAPIVGRYERDEIKPSIEVAKKIADELGVTVDYLLGGTDKMVLDKKMVKRMEEIEALPDKEKEKIFDYIDLVIRDIKIKKAHAS